MWSSKIKIVPYFDVAAAAAWGVGRTALGVCFVLRRGRRLGVEARSNRSLAAALHRQPGAYDVFLYVASLGLGLSIVIVTVLGLVSASVSVPLDNVAAALDARSGCPRSSWVSNTAVLDKTTSSIQPRTLAER